MNIKQKTGVAVGAAVIGVGAVLGVGYAMAGTSLQSQPQASLSADGTSPGGAPGGENGAAPGGPGGQRGMGNLAASLAEKLGLDETTVSQALQEVMQVNRPDGNGGTGRTDRDATTAKALAEKLGVDEAKVTAALAQIRSEQQANRPGDTGLPGGGRTAQPSPSTSA